MTTTPSDALPFEEPLNELKRRIDELLRGAEQSPELAEQAALMQAQAAEVEKKFFNSLSAWNTVEIARHPNRPQTRDYIRLTFDAFEELHGDRAFRDDLAIVTGLAKLGRHRVMLVGQHRGRNVHERHECHAGCPHPEGYRKALLKMRLAERMGLPIVCFIDTKGAYPGIGSEERGQGIALAENIRDMSLLRVPIICVVIGEGGSGGALALGVGDRILILRYAYYSVISPEGCASILWRDGEKKRDAAEVLKLTSRDLLERGFVDGIVEEPIGGAHRDPKAAGRTLRETLTAELDALVEVPVDELIERRYDKFRAFGEWMEGQTLDMLLPPSSPEPEADEDGESGAEPGAETDAGEGGDGDDPAQAGDAPAGDDESTAPTADTPAGDGELEPR